MTVGLAFPAIREASIWVIDKEQGLDMTFSMFSKGGGSSNVGNGGAGESGEGQNNNNNSPGKQSAEGGRSISE